MKMAHKLPRQTKTYLVDHYLCPLPSVRQLLIRRYVQFIQSVCTSFNPNMWQIAYLATNSTRSVTGKNVRNITTEFGLDPLLTNKKYFNIAKKEIPVHGAENIELLVYLLYIRDCETEDDVLEDLNALISDICSI